ncbi:hypothetical protein J056_001326 [Wallemia ichthyophaga EXF-994]|uniref:Uncharacterized protein n=1 Tax=Wallemia ichthyophaga (strain EXF-994 / CBS 113033) TaxID=1299270 RepID=R9ACI5_WALI9|nr:uncharacterized protein J056_001326 [Wallemia ichthyophaga EXF-994]EOQ99784.1 hypothetical protein J056_001326 [Wallemia ichthyophaga EXF-994]
MSRIFTRGISHTLRRKQQQQDWWFVDPTSSSTPSQSSSTTTSTSLPPAELPSSLIDLHNHLNTLPYLNKSSISWRHIDDFQSDSDELIDNNVSSALNPWVWAGKACLLDGIGERGIDRTFRDLRAYLKQREGITVNMYGLEQPERKKYTRKGLSNLRKSQDNLIKDRGSWGLIEHFDKQTGVSSVFGIWEKTNEADQWGAFE